MHMKSTHLPTAVLILCDIRSMENVGSMLRTADGVGIEKVYLVGITPLPIDRFGRKVGGIAKTALGAEETVAWEYAQEIDPLLARLSREGYQLIAIEQSESSVDYKTVQPVRPVAFMVGNEVEGLTTAVLEKADTIAEISLRGEKESLNVSVAAGVALFRMLDR